jgi:hypothetical protein
VLQQVVTRGLVQEYGDRGHNRCEPLETLKLSTESFSWGKILYGNRYAAVVIDHLTFPETALTIPTEVPELFDPTPSMSATGRLLSALVRR